MPSGKKKWLLLAAGIAAVTIAAIFLTGLRMARQFEPYLKQQAIEYLQKRFDSEVELASLTVTFPRLSPAKLFFSRGRGVLAAVEGNGVLLRHKGRRDLPPLLAMKSFHFEVDLGGVFEPVKHVARVRLEGLEIHVPPTGDRPISANQNAGSKPPEVVIASVEVHNAKLVILPKQQDRKPLEFQLHEIHLKTVERGRPMEYSARLTIPAPPGHVVSKGTFGPWNAGTPGDTALAGEYVFSDADLGVFPAIAGTLQSTGKFEGLLSGFHATGEARVPDFRLLRSGNRVPLATTFEADVDGTNGNTILKPVHAVLGSTRFVTTGAVIKHDGDRQRTIGLHVTIPDGSMADILRLAMPGSPMMAGRLMLNADISIPPLPGRVIEKIAMQGNFDIREGKFLKSEIQDKLDMLSRRGQGQPKNEAIDEVVSGMRGTFKLDSQALSFSTLQFVIPGAAVELAGAYRSDRDLLDFHGSLRLVAKVSQTMPGWKRIVLKPIDPFFARNGAGTFVRIAVTGSSKDPKFGRDKGSKDRR